MGNSWDEETKSYFCACRRTKFSYPEEFWGKSSDDIYQSEEDEFETYVLSFESFDEGVFSLSLSESLMIEVIVKIKFISAVFELDPPK